MIRFVLSLVAFGCCWLTTAPLQSAPKPNILLIMADDLGFSDLGCYGGEIETPNLDSIARDGLRYTQFYNTARCWPTRGALLTGFYAQQIRRDTIPGLVNHGGGGTRPDWAPLLPKYLKQAGYRSYHTGKWHIDGMPVAEGFDHSYYLKDQSRFFSPQQHWKDDQPLAPVERESGFYGTTALADHAIEVLREHDQQHGDQPFFHYLAFAAPHFPLHALPEDIKHYQERYRVGWDKIRAQRYQRMTDMGITTQALSAVEPEIGPPYHFPDHLEILGDGEVNKPVPWDSLTPKQKAFQTDKMAIHAAMIHRMDIEIGRVFDQIRKMNRWENTLVIFLSDNGASAEIMVRGDGHNPKADPGSADTYLCLGPGWSTACNTPFRRHKTWTHEGGVSTPFIVSWPRGIKAKREYRRTPAHVIDVAPTILELAGIRKIAKTAPQLPGKSLVSTFNANNKIERDYIWWYHDGHKAIYKDGWKAVAENGGEWDLFHLAKDRAESKDVSGRFPDRVIHMANLWNGQLNEFRELTVNAMTPGQRKKQAAIAQRTGKMKKAQRDALPPRKQVLFNAETLEIEGRPAFIMKPDTAWSGSGGKPWIFYAPTLRGTPDKAEASIHQKFLKAGIAVAGVDVGEAYGSPKAFPAFEGLYQEMIKRGFRAKPVLLGRSRGGLWVSSWAVHHPDRVLAIAGIYPVFDFTTYPGTKRAAPAYGLDEDTLVEKNKELNPIEQAANIANARIPIYIIHGRDDRVVPFAENSQRLAEIYRQNRAANEIYIKAVAGQGHNYWPGFFHDQKLIDFVIEKSFEK